MVSRQAGVGDNYGTGPNQVLTYTGYSVFTICVFMLLGVFQMIFRLVLSLVIFFFLNLFWVFLLFFFLFSPLLFFPFSNSSQVFFVFLLSLSPCPFPAGPQELVFSLEECPRAINGPLMAPGQSSSENAKKQTPHLC